MKLPSLKALLDKASQKISPKFKGWVLILTLLFITGFFLVNWFFINTLKKQYLEVTDKEARLYAVAISENLNVSELNWVFSEILRKSKFPIIISDKYNTPFNWKNIQPGWFGPDAKHIGETENYYQLTREEQQYLKFLIEEMDKKRKPLELSNNGSVFGYLHYGEERIVRYLSWMPFLEFMVLGLVFLIGYYGLHIIRSNEQSVLWVALAKETAHQMGTPLSSLLGWVELLKFRLKKANDEKNSEVIDAIENDISRLNRVSTRFSQIGSLPKLELRPLNPLVENTAAYFSTRLPQLGKKVDLELRLGDVPDIYMNSELIGWVLENLVKNALDSLQNRPGKIKIQTFYAKAEKTVHLKVIDNGRGIEKENWKKVFETGYSTKKRGWGLGLSLAKRIITIYHSGDIVVDWSSPYHETQFRITLPILPQIAKTKIHEKR